jgi:hypothetical protein
MNNSRKLSILLVVLLSVTICTTLYNQTSHNANALNEDIAMDSLNKNRLKLFVITGSATYALGSAGLYLSWYKDYPRSSFHFFNDANEWLYVDKAGHTFSAYAQSELLFKGYRWSGLNQNKALLYGAICSGLFQTTIEVMDGFSTNWGFSLSDFAANTVGTGTFVAQQKLWGEQKIRLKFSSFPQAYQQNVLVNGQVIQLQDRTQDLFGSSLIEKVLKDYNHQTYWISANINSVFAKSGLPQWLNLSLGYGANNMYGGFDNTWTADGTEVNLTSNGYQRYGQFYISLDADLSKVRTSSKFIRTLLDFLNTLKMPFSTIEINTLGEVKFHLLHF